MMCRKLVAKQPKFLAGDLKVFALILVKDNKKLKLNYWQTFKVNK